MSNILIVTPYFRPAQLGGGGQISVENLADVLKEDNTITIICYNHDFGKKTMISETFFINEHKIKIYFVTFLNFNNIRKDISSITFNYVYFNSFFSPICLLFQLYFFNSKKIISPKGEFYDAALKKKSVIKKLVIKIHRFIFLNTVFHSTSYHEVDFIKKHFPFSRIEIARDIPTFFNKNTIGYKRDDNNLNRTFKIIFSSRIDPKKNLSYIPQLLLNINGIVQFDIYGDIADKKYFEKVINDLKTLPNNILWNYCGRLNFNDAKNVFSNYDLFLFPTYGENFGYVICESLQCGCPILLSKNTTPWGDLEDEGVGYNIELQDTQCWVEKIKYYQNISNDDRKIISNLCLNYIQNKFDMNNIINENKKLFKTI